MDIALSCFLNASGLSRVARDYFRLFDDKGCRVIVIPLMEPSGDGLEPVLFNKILQAIQRTPSPSFIQLHLGGIPQGLWRVANCTALIGSAVFEGTTLTKQQYQATAVMDLIITPSFHCRNGCLSSGIPRKRVAYVPYVLDTATWNTSVVPSGRGDRFRFLYLNSWYERKGYDALLKAWWSEFTRDDPVELVIKSIREDTRKDPLERTIAVMADKMGVHRHLGAPIRIIDDIIADSDMPGFIKSHDSYVSPHRAEGFGMNPWHAMALGVPVICTAHGGVLDFCKPETAWLVPPTQMTEPSVAEVTVFPQYQGIKWAEPDIVGFRRAMRECLADPLGRQQRAEAGAKLVAKKYCPEVVLGHMKEAFDSLNREFWPAIFPDKDFEALVSQVCERFDGNPLKMVEI